VTEEQWLACNDPRPMILHMRKQRMTDLRLRKFAVACCRRICHLIPLDEAGAAVNVGEQFASGELHGRAVFDAMQRARACIERYPLTADWRMVYAAGAALATVYSADWIAAINAARCASAAVSRIEPPKSSKNVSSLRRRLSGVDFPNCDHDELTHQSGMLRCMVGNPFRPLVFDPAWRTQAVMGIATAIAKEEAFSLMPALGAALSDAGCTETSILEHCGGTKHVKGCWLVDALLGKA
jgi:hypothetical protein